MKIIIPIIPRGQERPRHARIGGFSKTYKSKTQIHEEEALMTYLLQHQPSEPIKGAVLFGCKAFFPIPASKPKKWKTDALIGLVRHESRPDLDNLLKNIKDCLTTMRFWEDDRKVVEYLPGTGKYYSDNPRWEIEIRPFVPGQEI